ncbi:MAG: hypothetical protein ACXQTW_05270 [Candidatus Methanospirareceae archaeon]
MSPEMLLLLALASVAVLSSLAVLLNKDNFYAALFMSVTLITVATVYALFGIQPVFVLIAFVFLGAICIVTVALAATYRTAPERQFSRLWGIIVLITASFLAFFSYISLKRQAILHPHLATGTIQFELQNFLANPEYILLVLSLSSLGILLMLSALKIVGGTAE